VIRAAVLCTSVRDLACNISRVAGESDRLRPLRPMTEASPETPLEPRIVGRYALFDEIAAGGMATVHLGRLVGHVGFSRIVAVKRLHPQYSKDQEFVSMFEDEARLASRIQHPNVVSTLDVVKTNDELFVVMEYVQGEPLSRQRHGWDVTWPACGARG
jgi:serine/threonine protein kinase